MSIPGSPVGPQPVEVDGELVLYGDGRTKQAFKDETDINKILKKAQRAGTLSHLERHGAYYADVSDVDDLLTAYNRVERAEEVFQDLPSEVRREFNNSWSEFFRCVNSPANAGRLRELLPALAEPGTQLIRPGTGRSDPNLGSPTGSAPSPSQPSSEPPASSDGGSASSTT